LTRFKDEARHCSAIPTTGTGYYEDKAQMCSPSAIPW